MAAPVRRLVALLFVVLLAGCSGPTPANPTPTSPSIATPPPTPHHRDSNVELVEVDGRWPIPLDGAGALARAAFGAQPGALIVGEASFGRAAAPILALDARAADLAGGLRDAATNASLAPPENGTFDITPALADAAGLHAGDDVTLVSYVWPASKVTSAFEMERVRPCDPKVLSPLCARPPTDGAANLQLTIPPGSNDLAFHADVVELRANDFPAFWNGTITAPDGTRTPFATGAYDRAHTLPPGVVPGALAPGDWSIRFTLDAGGMRTNASIAGFVTYRALGFSPFDTELLRLQDVTAQTRALLSNATRSESHLRVGRVISPDGAPALAGAGAVLALDDARALLALGDGNVTALAVPSRADGDAALAASAATSSTPALRALVTRALVPSPSPSPSPGPSALLWAPADATAAPLVVETLPPVGAEDHINASPLPRAPHLLTMPSDASALPWTLIPKALWPNATAALAAIATGPHLVLTSDDVAIEAGRAPAASTYLKLDLDGTTGTRTVFGMGSVAGGPSESLWTSAALAGAMGRPGGARVVTRDINATLAAVAGSAVWLGP